MHAGYEILDSSISEQDARALFLACYLKVMTDDFYADSVDAISFSPLVQPRERVRCRIRDRLDRCENAIQPGSGGRRAIVRRQLMTASFGLVDRRRAIAVEAAREVRVKAIHA